MHETQKSQYVQVASAGHDHRDGKKDVGQAGLNQALTGTSVYRRIVRPATQHVGHVGQQLSGGFVCSTCVPETQGKAGASQDIEVSLS